jgi:hypothetical protein
MWLENCKGNNNGLGVVSQGREHKMEDMPEWKEEFIKTVSGKLLRTISAFGRSSRMM